MYEATGLANPAMVLDRVQSTGLRDGVGHTVVGKDVTESDWARWLGIAASWSPSRRRWAARFHFGPRGFRDRTSRALAHGAALQPPPDAILQMRATFDATGLPGVPTYVY